MSSKKEKRNHLFITKNRTQLFVFLLSSSVLFFLSRYPALQRNPVECHENQSPLGSVHLSFILLCDAFSESTGDSSPDFLFGKLSLKNPNQLVFA